jgi:hypothetical protein
MLEWESGSMYSRLPLRSTNFKMWNRKVGTEGDWARTHSSDPILFSCLGSVDKLKILDAGCGTGMCSPSPLIGAYSKDIYRLNWRSLVLR